MSEIAHTTTHVTQERFVIQDDKLGIQEFELETAQGGLAENLESLSPETAQKLIEQEQAAILATPFYRKRWWLGCTALGTGAGVISGCASLATGSEYPTSTVIGGSALVAGLLTGVSIATGEYVNFLGRRDQEKQNQRTRQRISILENTVAYQDAAK